MKADGFKLVELYELGPVHAYDVAPVADPFKVRDVPVHTGFGDALALTEVGATFTVTTDVVAVVEPHVFVAVSV